MSKEKKNDLEPPARTSTRWNRRHAIGGLCIFLALVAYLAYSLSTPQTVSGQTGAPTREYIYLDGKAIAVEE